MFLVNLIAQSVSGLFLQLVDLKKLGQVFQSVSAYAWDDISLQIHPWGKAKTNN